MADNLGVGSVAAQVVAAEPRPSAAEVRVVAELASHVIPRLNRRFRSGTRELGMGMVSALFALDREGPMRSGDLARHEGVAAATMTRMVSGLVERRLVERLPDPDDGRACQVAVTAEGRRAIETTRQNYALEIETALHDLDVRQLAHVRTAMEELTASGLLV